MSLLCTELKCWHNIYVLYACSRDSRVLQIHFFPPFSFARNVSFAHFCRCSFSYFHHLLTELAKTNSRRRRRRRKNGRNFRVSSPSGSNELDIIGGRRRWHTSELLNEIWIYDDYLMTNCIWLTCQQFDMIQLICANDWCIALTLSLPTSFVISHQSLSAAVIRRWSDSDEVNVLWANNFITLGASWCVHIPKKEKKETVFLLSRKRLWFLQMRQRPFIASGQPHTHKKPSNGSTGSN